jgi:hypothetical protein
MFYILITDYSDNIVSEIKEPDFDSFIIRCYNFPLDESPEKLHIVYVRLDGETYHIPELALEKMIRF